MQKNIDLKSKDNIHNILNERSVIIVDNLSFWSLSRIGAFIYENREVVILYDQYNAISVLVVYFIAFMLRKKVYLLKNEIALGDLENGESTMGIKHEPLLADIARRLCDAMMQGRVCDDIIKKIPHDMIHQYAELEINEQLDMCIYRYLVAEWLLENTNAHKRACLLLQKFNPVLDMLIKYKHALQLNDTIGLACYGSLFYFAQRLKNMWRHILLTVFPNIYVLTNIKNDETVCPHIAAHFVEGFDLTRRSDVFWLPESGIDPHAVIVWADSVRSTTHPTLTHEHIDAIERQKMKWVFFPRRARICIKPEISRGRKVVVKKKYYLLSTTPFWSKNVYENWFLSLAETMYMEIQMWVSLLKLFNVKIYFDVGSPTMMAVIQHCALQEVGGVRIGVQRSTFKSNKNQFLFRYNANHIVFVWGNEFLHHQGSSKLIKKLIVSGYPFRIGRENTLLSQGEDMPDNLKDKFVVALFDNCCGRNIVFSKSMIKKFYESFLTWIMKDENVIVIIKEKRPHNIEGKNASLDLLLKQAEGTGRLIRLINASGRLPANASVNAHISIGVGISSPVIEAMLYGGRAVHCDLPKHYAHPYYKIGNNTLIFSAVEPLLDAIKQFKESNDNGSTLGDWKYYKHTIDPFCDEDAGQRIGLFIESLLENMKKGSSVHDAVWEAEKKYIDKYGIERIINVA